MAKKAELQEAARAVGIDTARADGSDKTIAELETELEVALANDQPNEAPGDTPVANDPLEEAKGGDGEDAGPPRETVQREERAQAAARVEQKKVDKKAPPPARPKVVDQRPDYRVTNAITISWGASQIRFMPGVVVSERTHGPGCISKFRNAGVALEEVKR